MMRRKAQNVRVLHRFGFGLYIVGVLATALLTGCMETTQDNVSVPGPSAFAGAVSAQNLDGSRIQVNWGAVPSGFASIQISQVQPDGSLAVVNAASTGTISYVVTGLTPSTLYSYVVQACDTTGTQCDGNHNVVSALTYGGINSSVSTSSLTIGTNVTSGAASVTFPGPGPNSSGINIYCHTSWNTTDALVGSLSSSAPSTSSLSLTLSGLYTGTNYICRAQAVIAATGKEDGNIQVAAFQTRSLSATSYQGVILVQAYGDAPSAPSSLNLTTTTASTAPSTSTVLTGVVTGTAGGVTYTPAEMSSNPPPTTRRVILTWASFNIASPLSSVYKVVRVPEGGIIDMTTTTLCTPTTASACQVCVSSAGTNAYSRTCTDAAIGPAPNRYQYAVTLVVQPAAVSGNGTYPAVEQMPSTAYFAPGDLPFRIDVPVPPSYMVLVHRDSVNYEMCTLMGKTVIPPQNDPRGSYGVYHTTCSYSGLGATPGNVVQGVINPTNSIYPAQTIPQSLGNTSNYDFGYNLFVDRYEAGCNWTPAANGAGGMCASNGTAGDCYGSSVPTSTQGADGNVYYDYATAGCYVSQRGTWYLAGNAALDTAHTGVAYSISPSAGFDAPSTTMRRTPPLVNVSQAQAFDICQSVSDANTSGQGSLTVSLASSLYGPKRLLRRREQVAAAAWQNWNGEPNPLTDNQITALQTGNIEQFAVNYTNLAYYQSCNSSASAGVTLTTNTNGMNFSQYAGSTATTEAFMIGSNYTSQCASRFGAQDMVGNVTQYLEEESSCTTNGSTETTCSISSGVDSTNTDYNSFSFNGTQGVDSSTSIFSTYPLWGPFNSNTNLNTGFGTQVYDNSSNWSLEGNNFLAPFGFPIVPSDMSDGGGLTEASIYSKLHNDTFGLAPGGTSAAASAGAWYYNSIIGGWGLPPGAGRFFLSSVNGTNVSAGFRCAMPAEIPQ
jgi:hypothetical protein